MMNRSCNLDVLMDLEYVELYIPILFYEERQKPFMTDIQTWQPGPEG